MHADQPPDLARRIVEELAGTMPTTDLADITDDQLAAVGQLAIQRRRDDKTVIGKIAAEYAQHRNKTYRDIANMLGLPYATVFRWAQPFLGSN
jgi:hypothetical protein